ncbi:ACD11 homolog protein-like [Panicum virgatum]|uniref:ACD11 homolog protein-like n=1 Tax=Panicum virgatum TaxID=38727 RepID=UPI0019D4FC22|nr:ACD11 homolog protein-like [Panicum virgatum]
METPLTVVTEAFKELACGMDADGGELHLAPFDDTCALVSVLFRSLGMAFRFAKIEYVTKLCSSRARADARRQRARRRRRLAAQRPSKMRRVAAA